MTEVLCQKFDPCFISTWSPASLEHNGKTRSVTLKFLSATEHTVDSKVYSSGDFTLIIKLKTVSWEI